jgi:hypothetical protein
MSGYLIDVVWNNAPTYTGNERLMLLAIADSADDDGRCFPVIEDLAKKCAVSVRTAQSILGKLEEDGVLTVSHGIETGHGKTNLYVLNVHTLTGDIGDTSTNTKGAV